MATKATDRRALIVSVAACAVAIGAVQAFGTAEPDRKVTASAESTPGGTDVTTTVAVDAQATTTTTGGAAIQPASNDLVGDEPGTAAGDGCTLKERSVQFGSSGSDVICLQQALIDEGFLSGTPSGSFDANTDAAVRRLQEERELFVDGVVGRESAIELGIWPDELALVVRTPKPPEGAVDLLGYPLSSVASAGDDAPPLPENSGSGRRLVYDRAGQRVWAVDDQGRIIRSWLVSGSKYNNELPGTHKVYSKSEESTAWNGKARLPLMVRWLDTERGAIGFHAIPISVKDGSIYQTEDELGQRLSGGCQRQANRDARFLWDFATIGTPVVVI